VIQPDFRSVRQHLGRLLRGVLLPTLILPPILALAGACGPNPEQVAADQEEIRQALEAYLPRLAEAYATGNIEVLRDFAVEKELASVDKLVGELAEQGRVLKPELQSLTIEKVDTWSHVNAYVTTLEVWDVYNYAAGTDVVLSQALGKAHRVKYQLKRRREGWQVLYRQVEQIFE